MLMAWIERDSQDLAALQRLRDMDRAAERWGVDVGDRIAVETMLSCRHCDPCLGGTYHLCDSRRIYSYIPLSDDPGLWGSYAQYMYLDPNSVVHKVDASLEPSTAVMFNPLGAGIRWGATIPETGGGDVVVVLGPGIRGLCAAVAAKEAGASFVAMTGLGERDTDRLALASAFGVDLTIDVAADDPAAALKRATGGLADVVVDVTAKAPALKSFDASSCRIP